MNKRIRKKRRQLHAFRPVPGIRRSRIFKYRDVMCPPSIQDIQRMAGNIALFETSVKGLVFSVDPPIFRRVSRYTSIDLSSPEKRRAVFNGFVHEWEHRRVERAARRRDRRRRRRRWASVYGHMHREEDWMPRP